MGGPKPPGYDRAYRLANLERLRARDRARHRVRDPDQRRAERARARAREPGEAAAKTVKDLARLAEKARRYRARRPEAQRAKENAARDDRRRSHLADEARQSREYKARLRVRVAHEVAASLVRRDRRARVYDDLYDDVVAVALLSLCEPLGGPVEVVRAGKRARAYLAARDFVRRERQWRVLTGPGDAPLGHRSSGPVRA